MLYYLGPRYAFGMRELGQASVKEPFFNALLEAPWSTTHILSERLVLDRIHALGPFLILI